MRDEKWTAEGENLVADANGDMVATVYGNTRHNAGVTKRRARLIAATPKLLKAVEMFTELWPVIDGDIKATPEVKAAWRAGMNALAEAQGKETCKHGFDLDFPCPQCGGKYS